jgi:DNA-binding response OmpR family regulator
MSPTVVVVAEDEPLLCTLFADYLRNEGYDVIDVANGRLALEVVRQRQVDVVIADGRMPELGGRDLYEALRLFQRDLCEAFILITGWDDPETDRFLARVSVPVIHKPFSLTVLRETIEAVLHRRPRASSQARTVAEEPSRSLS